MANWVPSARSVKVFAEPNTGGQYSTTVWKSYNYPVLWDSFLARKISVPMYINSGDDDEFMIESDAAQLYAQLRRNKQPAELRIVNGKHEWPVWESTIGDALNTPGLVEAVIVYYSNPVAVSPDSAKVV